LYSWDALFPRNLLLQLKPSLSPNQSFNDSDARLADPDILCRSLVTHTDSTHHGSINHDFYTTDQGTKSATIAVLDSEAHPTGKKRFGIVIGGWNLVTGCCVSPVDGSIDEGELRTSYGNEEEKMEYRINYRYIDVFLHRKGLDKMGFSFVYIEREWAKHQRLFP
jgi:hypothetical protein